MAKAKKELTLLRLKLLKDFDYQVIDQLIYGVGSFTAQEQQKLSAEAKKIQSQPDEEGVDKAWLIDMLGDDHFFLDEAKKLSHELAIVALYKKVEISTKRAIKFAYPDVDERSLFKIKDLKSTLKVRGINIEKLPSYSGMDEIRCINNDIKHNGVVGKELAAYSGWEKGKPLSGLDSAYNRLAPCCSLYMGELVGAIIKEVST